MLEYLFWIIFAVVSIGAGMIVVSLTCRSGNVNREEALWGYQEQLKLEDADVFGWGFNDSAEDNF